MQYGTVQTSVWCKWGDELLFTKIREAYVLKVLFLVDLYDVMFHL